APIRTPSLKILWLDLVFKVGVFLKVLAPHVSLGMFLYIIIII
ncbi:unnamed protein product, partial [Vitis vinifera]